MSMSLKKKSHWTNKVHEIVICRSEEGELGFDLKGGAENGHFPYLGEVKQGKVVCQSGKLSQDELLKGGAENGHFPYLGEVKQGKVVCQSGKLSQDELLLEVNDTPVAGLTIRDVLAVVKHCKDPIRLKCVKQAPVADGKKELAVKEWF
ncbi:UNVERIFIED_CONTAM: hypothetical protein FKN15_033874 [Acipenser sinensis]